jgi:hypothetical protein
MDPQQPGHVYPMSNADIAEHAQGQQKSGHRGEHDSQIVITETGISSIDFTSMRERHGKKRDAVGGYFSPSAKTVATAPLILLCSSDSRALGEHSEGTFGQ